MNRHETWPSTPEEHADAVCAVNGSDHYGDREDRLFCYFCGGPLDDHADRTRGACLPCYHASGEPLTVADRLRMMAPARAWQALCRLANRFTLTAPAPLRVRRYHGGGIAVPGALASDSYRYPAVLAMRFRDGSAVALREPRTPEGE